ncbi:hypothetical protein RB595_010412 [Gaeumannomyces hyphopodioides]
MDPRSNSNAPSGITPPADRNGFYIAIICALAFESDPVILLLDKVYDVKYGRATGDPNTYKTGSVGGHDIVLLVLPGMGKEAAAACSRSLLSSFPNVKLGLIVGVCGGLPNIDGSDVFLGDVVISTSIINYDLGRQYTDHFEVKSAVEDSLGRANYDIRGLLALFKTEHDLELLQERASTNLAGLQEAARKKKRRTRYNPPPDTSDRLFRPDYEHIHRRQQCDVCSQGHFCEPASTLPCDEVGCDASLCEPRLRREEERPVEHVPQIFMGKAASGDTVMKSGLQRDRIARAHGVVAFEMEGAGAWDQVPCIVIKGVCDYADSHKNKQWQPFAAATAASVAVAILDQYQLPDGAAVKAQTVAEGRQQPSDDTAFQGGKIWGGNVVKDNTVRHDGTGHVFQGITGDIKFNVYHTAPETPPQPFASIPFSRDADFVGRGDVLAQLRQRCSEPASRMALVGLGGIGKSQLAIEFAHRKAEESAEDWIFWIHAGTQARVEEGFQAIADILKLPGRDQPNANIPQLAYSWLSNKQNGRWTIILDSADDKDVLYEASNSREGKPLANYLPQSPNGSFVITTRNQNLARRLTGNIKNIIEIGPMVLADALLLLEKRLGSFSNPDKAKSLVEALDFVPLAISQAAAYIQARSPMSSVEKYFAEFLKGERKQGQLLGYDAGEFRRDGAASNAILTTWQISFEHIRSQRPSAADLLSLMSFFDRQGIVLSLLKPANAEDMQQDSGSKSDSSSDEVDNGFEDDVTMLRDFCLVAITEDGSALGMHALVQLCTRMWLRRKDGLKDNFKRQLVKRMAAAFPTGGYSNWEQCRQLFAHVKAAADHGPVEEETKEWANLMYNGGWYALSQGQYEVAKRMARKAQRSNEKRKDDEWTLASTNVLAEVYLRKGLWAKAESLRVQVMETCKTKLGVDHPSTLTSMANLASTFWNQGRWQEAEKLGVEVMETRKTKLGVDHPDTLTSMANLASTYRNQGRWQEAEKLFVKVMETRKTKLGVDHPSTLTSMANLASTYSNQGRWQEAEKLGVEVMETSKTKLGVDHPDTLTSMANLASTYSNQGWWQEAEKLEVKVMETRKTKLGVDHPDTLTSMANLASTFWNQGRRQEAEKLEVEVMETRKTKLGVDHPDTLTSMNNLAFTWKDQGRHAKALALMNICAQARQRVLGPDHPYTLSSLSTVSNWSR